MKLLITHSPISVPLLLACLLTSASGRAATLSVSPSAISNAYTGAITLQVGGLTNGETVRIEKFADGDANGVVGANDELVQSFLLIDGLTATIGGLTNLNVPSDYGPTNGATVTSMNFQAGGVGQALAGGYAYVLSSPTGRFTPVTNLFNVTDSAFAQSITGTVVSSGTNVPYASVMLFAMSSNEGMDFVAGAVANSSGGYAITAPVGTYFLLTTRNGYIPDMSSAPILSLGPGATINTNLSLIAGTRRISGKAVDSVNTNQGLPGLMIVCESAKKDLAIGFTDANGNFTIPVTADQWHPGSDEKQVAFYGYLRPSNQTNFVDTTAGNVSGVTILLSKVTALIYGSVRDAQNQPLAGIGLYASQDNGSGPYESGSTTDQSGNYTLGIVSGNWQASVDNNSSAYPNYVFSTMDNTNLSAGRALLRNFVGIVATNHITGIVRNGSGNPITNLDVYGRAEINSTMFNVNATTDGGGNYSLNVANGTWYVGLNCDLLTSLGLTCPGEKSTNILNGNRVVNFIASDLEITTTSLPDATMDAFYSQSLSASGGQAPYTWSLSPGWTELPFGLTLGTNGVLSGTPTGFGSTFFGVRVTDNQGASADGFFNLNINQAPLQITTPVLPNGTNGQFYFQTLEAAGGNPPYNWYLPGGSMTLPSGLSLSANGILSGTPSTNGTFNFSVAAYVNSPYQSATQNLSLTINGGSSPLQVTTASLANGTNGTFYTHQLLAAGGQSPYRWRVPDYSADLPANLILATNGVLSGTPIVNGTFYFDVEVDDAAANSAYQTLSLTIINPPPLSLLITNVSLPNGNIGAAYSAQFGATGGQSPYIWSLAAGSANPPAGLTLAPSGLISGTPTTNKVSTFKVQVTDANFTTTNKILSITINPQPVLGSPSWLTNRFQMRLTGASNQFYTVQRSTNLSSTNWISLFITNNPTTNSFLLADPNATNKQQFYRVLIGP